MKSLGKGYVMRRHRKLLRNNIDYISQRDLRRLARKAGVKRINTLVFDEMKICMRTFLFQVIKDTATYTEHARRKTVSVIDVLNALKRSGKPLYF